ncbi:MAG TPA: hypothetical protein VGS21_06120 [Acidimicrobiales bacterium]|nr:hypothetical protein [Acidimicrobiales bacterium]
MSGLSLLAALKIEARALKKGAPKADVQRTGMGPEKAMQFARSWRPADGARVVVVGFAGGLGADIRVGDVVVASELSVIEGRDHDLQLSDRIPLDVVSSADLVARLEQAGCKVHLGPITCSPVIVKGRDQRYALRRAGAVAVDMESWWLARGLAGSGRFGVVRVITDSETEELVSPSIVRNGLKAYNVAQTVAKVVEQWDASLARGNWDSVWQSASQPVTGYVNGVPSYGTPAHQRPPYGPGPGYGQQPQQGAPGQGRSAYPYPAT